MWKEVPTLCKLRMGYLYRLPFSEQGGQETLSPQVQAFRVFDCNNMFWEPTLRRSQISQRVQRRDCSKNLLWKRDDECSGKNILFI